MIVITPWVRFWRFVRLVLGLTLVIVAFGLGVVSGTSGIYSDGVNVLRNSAGVEPSATGMIARVFDTLDRLDVTKGIELARTRQDVAKSMAGLGETCETRLNEIYEDIKATVNSGTGKFERVVAKRDLKQIKILKDQIKILNEQIERLDNLSEKSTSTETFCALTYKTMSDILNVSPEPLNLLSTPIKAIASRCEKCEKTD